MKYQITIFPEKVKNRLYMNRKNMLSDQQISTGIFRNTLLVKMFSKKNTKRKEKHPFPFASTINGLRKAIYTCIPECRAVKRMQITVTQWFVCLAALITGMESTVRTRVRSIRTRSRIIRMRVRTICTRVQNIRMRIRTIRMCALIIRMRVRTIRVCARIITNCIQTIRMRSRTFRLRLRIGRMHIRMTCTQAVASHTMHGKNHGCIWVVKENYRSLHTNSFIACTSATKFWWYASMVDENKKMIPENKFSNF